jgi:hypothetical protein
MPGNPGRAVIKRELHEWNQTNEWGTDARNEGNADKAVIKRELQKGINCTGRLIKQYNQSTTDIETL